MEDKKHKVGLYYIRNLYNITLDELGEKVLDVGKATVSKYESGKIPISEDKLKLLSKYFGGISEKYFQKELTQIEMLHLQVIKAIDDSRKIENDSDEYENKMNEVTELFHLEIETSTLESIKQNIDFSYKNSDDKALLIYIELSNILEKNIVNPKILFSFFKAIKTLYGLEEKSEENEKDSDKLLVNCLINILQKYK